MRALDDAAYAQFRERMISHICGVAPTVLCTPRDWSELRSAGTYNSNKCNDPELVFVAE